MDTILVTAFFDIGREKSGVAGMDRSNAQYFEYFKFWARMYNQVIVYTQPEFVDEVLKIRESFSLQNKTVIVPIEDISQIEPEIFNKMKIIESKNEWSNMRMYTKAMSNSSRYNYIMLMKYWFIKDACERLHVQEGQIAWMDFGFNHGGKCFTDPTDFDFEWRPQLGEGIHVFALNNPDNKSSIGMLLLQSDCLMGSPVICSYEFCEILWNHIKEAIEALLMLDAIDDDQQLLLMAYRKYPNDFHIHYSNWFLPIKKFGGEHIKVKENYGITETINDKKTFFLLKIKRKLVQCYLDVKGLNSSPSPHDFGKRMEKYAKKEKK